MRHTPKAGELYRHCNGNLYQVVTISKHHKTGEKLVIYQALYGDYQVYARPLESFIGKANSGKYPNGVQEYRFEIVERELELEEIENHKITVNEENHIAKEEKVYVERTEPNCESFFDAKSYKEKLEIIRQIRKDITERELENLAVSADIVLEDKTLEEKIDSFIGCLQTKIKYESARR